MRCGQAPGLGAARPARDPRPRHPRRACRAAVSRASPRRGSRSRTGRRRSGLAPDRSRTWFGLGDVLFHMGAVARIAGAEERARNAFDRALALDSASVPALLHRIELAARAGRHGDGAPAHAAGRARDSPGDALEFLRWRAAVALGDEAARRRIEPGAGFPEHLRPASGSWDGASSTGSAWRPRPVRSPCSAAAPARARNPNTCFPSAVALAGNRGPFLDDAPGGRALRGERRPDHAPLFYASGEAVAAAARHVGGRRWPPVGTPRSRTRDRTALLAALGGRPRDPGRGAGVHRRHGPEARRAGHRGHRVPRRRSRRPSGCQGAGAAGGFPGGPAAGARRHRLEPPRPGPVP